MTANIGSRHYRRSYLRVSGDILTYLSKTGVAATKYQIVRKTNINYDMFCNSMEDLIQNGLVECRLVENGRAGGIQPVYCLTDRGREASQIIQRLNSILTVKPAATLK
jgi:predicted transcriptional regulator